MKILFITSNRIGDAVLSTGLLSHLLKQFPKARVTIVCGPYASELFSAVPRLDAIIVLEKRRLNAHWLALWRQTFSTRWDLIIDLRNSVVSRLLRSGERHIRVVQKGQHKVKEIAATLQLDPPPAPRLWLSREAVHEAEALLPSMRPLLALAPTANWPCKEWPHSRFAALSKRLLDRGSVKGVIVIAGGHERAALAPLLKAMPLAVPVLGQDLLTVAACLKACRLFIGNDSGLMHMAAAMGIPTLGLFGPGYEDIYGPWGSQSAYVRTDEARATLLKKLPHPGSQAPNLMQSLSVDKAYQAGVELLTRTEAANSVF